MPTVTKQANRAVPNKVLDAKDEARRAFLAATVPISQLPKVAIKMLITGDTGTGKTTLACDADKPLILIRPESVEDGSNSVVNIGGVFCPPKLTHDEQLDWLVEEQMQTRKYKTIVLDGAQFYQDLVLKRVLSLQEVPAQLSWGIAKQQEWGIVANEFKVRMRRLFALADPPYSTNIIVTGGERILEDEKKILPPKIVVALTPSAAGWMNYVADYIVCTFNREKEITENLNVGGKIVPMVKKVGGIDFCARLVKNDLYVAKFRVPRGTKLDEIVVDPTWAKLIRYIRGGK